MFMGYIGFRDGSFQGSIRIHRRFTQPSMSLIPGTDILFSNCNTPTRWAPTVLSMEL